jgi:hypothetical protein
MKGNILIIEDEEDLTNTLKQLLAKYADEIKSEVAQYERTIFLNKPEIEAMTRAVSSIL